MGLKIDFWKSHTKEVFDNAFVELCDAGWSETGAQKFLESLYYAVGNEYGD